MIITWKSIGLEMAFLSQFESFDPTPPDIRPPNTKKGVGVTPPMRHMVGCRIGRCTFWIWLELDTTILADVIAKIRILVFR